MKNKLQATNIESAYNSIKSILENARSKAYRAINFAMVEAYWNIGRVIVEEEQKGKHKAEYGAGIIRDLSARLSREYGKGFDESNLRNIRQFYLTFPKCDALRHELSWTHYRLLLRVEKEEAEKESSGVELSTFCRQLKLAASDGKYYETDCANTEKNQNLYILQYNHYYIII